jgi:sporulation protein YlmC with PRC-barrel domain
MPSQIHPTQRSAPSGSAHAVVAESVADWKGHEVIDLEAEKVGKLQDVFYDVETDDAVFITVKSGLIGKSLTLVPVAGASVTPSTFRVNFRKAEVKDAPGYDPDLELTVDQEAGAYQHYGLEYVPAANAARRLARR